MAKEIGGLIVFLDAVFLVALMAWLYRDEPGQQVAGATSAGGIIAAGDPVTPPTAPTAPARPTLSVTTWEPAVRLVEEPPVDPDPPSPTSAPPVEAPPPISRTPEPTTSPVARRSVSHGVLLGVGVGVLVAVVVAARR